MNISVGQYHVKEGWQSWTGLCPDSAREVSLEYRPELPSVLFVVLARTLNQTESTLGSSRLHWGDLRLFPLSLEILFWVRIMLSQFSENPHLKYQITPWPARILAGQCLTVLLLW